MQRTIIIVSSHREREICAKDNGDDENRSFFASLPMMLIKKDNDERAHRLRSGIPLGFAKSIWTLASSLRSIKRKRKRNQLLFRLGEIKVACPWPEHRPGDLDRTVERSREHRLVSSREKTCPMDYSSGHLIRQQCSIRCHSRNRPAAMAYWLAFISGTRQSLN